MCLAIFKKPDGVVTTDQLINGWCGNGDGGGFAYVKDGGVVISKGHMQQSEFLEAYEKAYNDNKGSPFLIHFRIRSMGDMGEGNTHPFAIPSGALIHNGTLDGTAAKYGEGPSDTWMFAHKYGKYLNYEHVEKYKKSWNDVLGFNKMVMLYDDGRHQIINESTGNWVNGTWFSNYSYKAALPGMDLYDDADDDWEQRWRYH